MSVSLLAMLLSLTCSRKRHFSSDFFFLSYSSSSWQRTLASTSNSSLHLQFLNSALQISSFWLWTQAARRALYSLYISSLHSVGLLMLSTARLISLSNNSDCQLQPSFSGEWSLLIQCEHQSPPSRPSRRCERQPTFPPPRRARKPFDREAERANHRTALASRLPRSFWNKR